VEKMIKNRPPLIQESKDKCKKVHHLRKLLKIRTKTKEENNPKFHKGDFLLIDVFTTKRAPGI